MAQDRRYTFLLTRRYKVNEEKAAVFLCAVKQDHPLYCAMLPVGGWLKKDINIASISKVPYAFCNLTLAI